MRARGSMVVVGSRLVLQSLNGRYFNHPWRTIEMTCFVGSFDDTDFVTFGVPYLYDCAFPMRLVTTSTGPIIPSSGIGGSRSSGSWLLPLSQRVLGSSLQQILAAQTSSHSSTQPEAAIGFGAEPKMLCRFFSSSPFQRTVFGLGASGLLPHNPAPSSSLSPAVLVPKRLCGVLFSRTFALAATGTSSSSLGALDPVETVDWHSGSKTQMIMASAAATEALENCLRMDKGLQPRDAKLISRNCPVFIQKVMTSVMRQTSKKGEKVVDKLSVEWWLKKSGMNELEPFLESIGMNPDKMDEVLPLLKVPLAGEQGLLRSVDILESFGISRWGVWDVLEQNKWLLTLTPADLRASVALLEGLGVKRGKDMVNLIQDSFFLTDNLETLKNLQKLSMQKHVIADILKSDPPQSGGTIDMPAGCFQERADFLLQSGLSKSEVAQRLKLFPQLLHMRLENLKRKIQFFDSIGLEREMVAKVIARWPLVFRSSMEKKLRPKIEMLQSLGVGSDGIAKILTRYPELGAVSLEDNLKQKVAFFEANGLTGRRLVKLMTSHPRALTLSVSDLKKKLEFLVQKGFALESVEMVRALGVCVTISLESMEARFSNLESLGFSLENSREVVKQQPAILTLSEKCIQRKVHYLLNHMKRNIEEIVKCPCYLLYSLELRIKPRHRVLSLLKLKGVLREEAYSLNTILIMSEKRFMERFVLSLGADYPQVAAAYVQSETIITPISNSIDSNLECVSTGL